MEFTIDDVQSANFLSAEVAKHTVHIYEENVRKNLKKVAKDKQITESIIETIQQRYYNARYPIGSYVGVQAGQDLIAPITQAKLKSFYNVGFGADDADVLTRYEHIMSGTASVDDARVYLYFKHSSLRMNETLVPQIVERKFKDFLLGYECIGKKIVFSLSSDVMIAAKQSIDMIKQKLDVHKTVFHIQDESTLYIEEFVSNNSIEMFCESQMEIHYPELPLVRNDGKFLELLPSIVVGSLLPAMLPAMEAEAVKLKYTFIEREIDNVLYVACDYTKNYYDVQRQSILDIYTQIPISGIESVYEHNCVAFSDHIVIRGIHLKTVLSMRGVDHERTYSTNIGEVYKAYGLVRAATVMHEQLIQIIFHGTPTPYQEQMITLLVNALSHSGKIASVNYQGLVETGNDFFTRLSYERTGDTLESVWNTINEPVNSVAAKMIIGLHL